jgi:hypothetical protein
MPPRKVLAIKLRSLGDTVILTAPLAELRRAWPDAEIHVATIAACAPSVENPSAGFGHTRDTLRPPLEPKQLHVWHSDCEGSALIAS